MKTLAQLKRFMFLGILGVAVSGCLDSDNDPEFQIIGGNSYVIQRNVENGDNLIKDFTPYVWVAGNSKLSNVEVKSSDDKRISGKILEFYWESNTGSVSDITNLNGSYTITATARVSDTEEQQDATAFTWQLENSNAMGKLVVKELKFEGTRISASWEKVDNATAVGIAYCPTMIDEYGGASFYRMFTKFDNVSRNNISNNRAYLETNFQDPYEEGTTFQVKVVAIHEGQGGTVVLESQPKLFKKGDSHFIGEEK